MGQADNTPLCTKHQKNTYKKLLYSFSMVFFFYIQLILHAKAFGIEGLKIKN